MNHLGTQTIQTARLILRRVRFEDGAVMYRNWASDPDVTKYLTWPTHENVETSQWVVDEWVKSYEKPDFYQWGIEYDGEPIGSISVVELRGETAEIGYCIGRAWWHKGIVSEALAGVMEFLFNKVGVLRIEASHDINNPNSGGVMRKCGMKFVQTRCGQDKNNQGVCDVHIYGLDRSAWKK